MKIGDKKTLKIPAKEAYGERDPKNTQEVPKAQLGEFEKAGIKLEV
jgi:FKBP-type peptidyl-prolyl cis-trans isomerase 2